MLILKDIHQRKPLRGFIGSYGPLTTVALVALTQSSNNIAMGFELLRRTREACEAPGCFCSDKYPGASKIIVTLEAREH
jgi:hypothetical protein